VVAAAASVCCLSPVTTDQQNDSVTWQTCGLLVALVLLAGCYSSIALPEVDTYGVPCAPDVLKGKNEEEITSILAPLTIDSIYGYPIRTRPYTAKHICVPAPLLEVVFDSGGVAVDQHFVHPRTGERLLVAETLNEADRRRSSECRPPPRIELDSIVREKMTNVEVANLLGRPADVAPTNEGEIWRYYVDRPSPLFVRPSYLQVRYQNGRVVAAFAPGSGGGCK